MDFEAIINSQEVDPMDLALAMEHRLNKMNRELAVRDAIIAGQHRALVGAQQGLEEAQAYIGFLQEQLAHYQPAEPEEGTVTEEREEPHGQE